MSETQPATTQPTASPLVTGATQPTVSTKKSTRQKTIRIGSKIIRIDAASIDSPSKPHTPIPNFPVEQTPLPQLDQAFGSIAMGIGNVVENNAAFQKAAKEMAGAVTTTPLKTGPLQLKPAWEVDYFRWPRLSRRLLRTQMELFDQIGGQILKELQPTQMRIGVCSTFAREGTSTIATCLARWAATRGRRALLVDADIETPRLTVMSGLDCEFGWQAVLDSNMPITELMIRSSENGLTFLPSRVDRKPMIVEKSIDRLSMITFQMKYEFDVVIVDLGKVEDICAHGTESMDVVDAVVITRDPSQTSVGQVMDTRSVLNNLGIKKTWVAQNFARKEAA